MGAPDCQNVRTGGREVDMILAVIYSIAGTAIATRCGNGDAQQACLVGDMVEVLHGLMGPVSLGISPTYGKDRRLVQLIMDRCAQRVLESAFCVGCEVDDD